MRVDLITGSYPPDVCGVGDYTEKLEKQLKKHINLRVIYKYQWKLTELFKIRSDIYSKPVDIIHIQYPTVGFGYSLIPQLLTILCRNVIVTIHEVSQAHILRKISLYPFFIFARHLVFTSEYEKIAAQKLAPWITKKTSIIPIGSNISPIIDDKLNTKNEIIYFGIIHPNKGIETVLELARIIDKSYTVHIIGKVEQRFEVYLKKLKQSSKQLNIIWSINKDEQEVAHLLSKAKYAYLPFPDGASERRGSLLAVMINKTIAFSTKGPFTTNNLERAIIIVNNPTDVVREIKLFDQDHKKTEKKLNDEFEYIKNTSWDSISSTHISLYQKLTEKP